MCMNQNFGSNNDLKFEDYKPQLDKSMTTFFKRFINWENDGIKQLGSSGYLGAIFWQALNKMSGRISAVYEGLLYDMTFDDIMLGSKAADEAINIMDVDKTKALQLKVENSFINSWFELFKTKRSTPTSLRKLMEQCPFIDYT